MPFLPFLISGFCTLMIPLQPLPSFVGVGLSFVSVLFLSLGLIQMWRLRRQESNDSQEKIKAEREPASRELESFLLCMSHQRHDWLNHLQVLLGYLKLQRYDFCEEYIKKVTDIANKESQISHLGYQPLVMYLLTFNALHKELTLEVELPGALSLTEFPVEDQERIYTLITGIIEIYRSYALDNQGDPNVFVLHIQMLEESLYISSEYEGNLDEENSLSALHTLVKNLGNGEGFFVEGLHNNSESIMEFYVPLSVKTKVMK
ncbi:Spo0B domain-containing protein [Ammoniphilus resinae]|nr:Spo0B domain-containing protein [Ammoniphilus resinae]